MCARDNVMVLAFDPQIKMTKSGYNAAEWSWWTEFSFGRIAGTSTCLSSTESLGQTKQGSYYGAGTYASTFITADSGLSGTDANGTERRTCWCKMTHPVTSQWVLRIVESSIQNCTNGCANYCGSEIGNLITLRKGVFEAIGLKD